MDCSVSAFHCTIGRNFRPASLAVAVFLQGEHHSTGGRMFRAVSLQRFRHPRQKASLFAHGRRPRGLMHSHAEYAAGASVDIRNPHSLQHAGCDRAVADSLWFAGCLFSGTAFHTAAVYLVVRLARP